MKIYMVMPPQFKTGGTELGHQFVKCCNDLGIEAVVAYSNVQGGGRPLMKLLQNM